MAAVPVSETAAANSFNTLMRSIGAGAALTALAIASFIPTRQPVQAGKPATSRTADAAIS
ncbi:MAG TPA: hypothetical protein VFI00_02090 [Kribbella sp.]|nr:hypothetical protein [Kribbella sp.]